VHELACNWKTYTDNYLEGYHIPFVHPTLARAIDVASYEVEVHDGWVAHSARARDGSVATGTWLYHWPNLALNLYEHGMSVERWFPTGPRTCTLVLDFLFADTGDQAMVRNRLDVESSARICVEDRVICELVQRNLESGAFDEGWLAPGHESALAEFQRRVRRARGAGACGPRPDVRPGV
jgi:choline monooxygenase